MNLIPNNYSEEVNVKNKKFILISTAILVLAGAILLVGTALASVPPITGDNKCGSERFVGANGLAVKKDVFCEKDRQWTWDIDKSADQTDLTLSVGQTMPVNYIVTASALAADTNFKVEGNIGVTNLSGAPIEIASVSDSLGAVSCGVTFPYTLEPKHDLLCTYTGSLGSPAAQNVATATDIAGFEVSVVADIDWNLAAVTETDECVLVTDSYAGELGTVCAGDITTFTFPYTRDLVYDVCGPYTEENIASFTTDDTGATGSDDWTVIVDVPCEGGCTLTPGYWKTHSIYGPAPYDDTWALIGEDTPFFMSGKSYYQALWTAPAGNAYYILAHAYIAAELNFLNGASSTLDVDAAFDAATALFETYTPAQIADKANKTVRAQFIALAEILDDYNNGLYGPGHCSEETFETLSTTFLYALDWVFLPTLAR